MSCRVCASNELLLDCPAELNLHLPGIERIAEPSVYFSRQILVCLNCGHADLVIPAAKLKQLREGLRHAANADSPRSGLFGFGSALERNT